MSLAIILNNLFLQLVDLCLDLHMLFLVVTCGWFIVDIYKDKSDRCLLIAVFLGRLLNSSYVG